MKVVLVPGVLALLPEYAGRTDPVAELRAACLEAVSWLGGGPVSILADAQGKRVARGLLSAAGGFEAQAPERLRTSTTGSERVARGLLSAAGGFEAQAPERLRTSTTDTEVEVRGAPATSLETTDTTMVVGNGSACRTEKAPGFLDERAAAYDDDLRAALLSGDVSGIDLALGRELLASVDAFAGLPRLGRARVDYDDAPFGVQYWVMRWES